jgi:formylglycine-generating enzyme required for sulfatase activity
VRYRLPREDEWEYAARGGSEDRLYPWGNNWCDDCANLGTGKGEKVDHAEAVGSHQHGADRWGILDLIGNVWEWTISPASFYDGNPVQQDQRGWFVIRGGSHQSLYGAAPQQRGGKEFPATLRAWLSRDTKSHALGFRLVRDAS